MAYWLFKSEPSVFSFADLKAAGRTDWNGVRNYQARNLMISMQLGDQGFFYHSNAEVIGIVGIVEVVRTAYPDHSALDPTSRYFDPKATPANPIWQMVDVAFHSEFPRTVTLTELKATPSLEEMPLLRRGQRLSVQPVNPQEWQIICELAHTIAPRVRPYTPE
jgi:predicted RNA-binding protein with PUA-like domain